MDFKHLAEVRDLHEKTLAAARAEKAATFYLLECLHRVEQTRAHIELSYPTLFEYVHRALGYSESQSYERIAAMRLSFRVPAVAAALKTGDLSLTSVARIASHAKREKLRPVSKTTSILTITVDQEFEALLREARELEPSPGVSTAEILKKALRARVEKKRREKGIVAVPVLPKPEKSNNSGNAGQGSPTGRAWKAQTAVAPHGARRNNRPHIPIQDERALWQRSTGQCEIRSPYTVTGVRCKSRQSLQIDHKVPVALGGSSKLENLQHLCAVHNRAKGMT